MGSPPSPAHRAHLAAGHGAGSPGWCCSGPRSPVAPRAGVAPIRSTYPIVSRRQFFADVTLHYLDDVLLARIAGAGIVAATVGDVVRYHTYAACMKHLQPLKLGS